MKAIKLKWTVCPKETGPYASFHPRGWPSAHYSNGDIAAHIRCEDAYSPKTVKAGNHAVLYVHVAAWAVPRPKDAAAFEWRKCISNAKDLVRAKAIAQDVINTHPELWPAEYRDISHPK